MITNILDCARHKGIENWIRYMARLDYYLWGGANCLRVMLDKIRCPVGFKTQQQVIIKNWQF